MSTAQLILDTTVGKWNLMFEGKIIASSTAKYYLRQQVRQGRYREQGITDCVDVEWENVDTANANLVNIDASVVGDKFSINERFDFVYQCAKAAGMKSLPSLILTGEGGLGKTHTVMKALADAGLTNIRTLIGADELEEDDEITIGAEFNDTSYCVIKGYSTARGLFNALYENRNRVIVFDDCDSVLRDITSAALLKAALDSEKERWITWNADAAFGDDTPRTFRFYGSVICITNKPLSSIDQAVRTRSVCIDLSMTTNQIIERMVLISGSEDFMPGTTTEAKEECLALVDEFKDRIRGLSLRTLITVINLRESCEDWKRVAEYVICR